MVVWQVGETLEDVEKNTILAAMKFYGNNRETTARAIGLHLRTLHSKLKEYKDKEDLQKKAADERKAKKIRDFEESRNKHLPIPLPTPDSMKAPTGEPKTDAGRFRIKSVQNVKSKLTDIPFSIVSAFEDQCAEMFGKSLKHQNEDGGLRAIDVFALVNRITVKEAQEKHTHKSATEWLESL